MYFNSVTDTVAATYGFMDGEHAFSAALTLIMVNVAFPYNDQNATAMETALSVLHNMGEKGNDYLQARYALLMRLRSNINPSAPPCVSSSFMPLSANSYSKAGTYQSPGSVTMPHDASLNSGDFGLLAEGTFGPYENISFSFDTDDDPSFWEEISGNIDIAMETGWIENALGKD